MIKMTQTLFWLCHIHTYVQGSWVVCISPLVWYSPATPHCDVEMPSTLWKLGEPQPRMQSSSLVGCGTVSECSYLHDIIIISHKLAVIAFFLFLFIYYFFFCIINFFFFTAFQQNIAYSLTPHTGIVKAGSWCLFLCEHDIIRKGQNF